MDEKTQAFKPEYDPSPAAFRHLWPQLEVENMLEYLVYLGSSPLVEKHISDELAWVITGVDDNSYNGVAWARLNQATANDVIDDVLHRFRAAGIPALWTVTTDSLPVDLGHRLKVRGCIQLSGGIGMAIDLDKLIETPTSIPGLEIRRVLNPADMALWCGVYSSERERREPLYISLGLSAESPLCHYLALMDGIPIATSSLFLGQHAAGLYHVEVIPSARRRGIGSAIALAPLKDAHKWGYHVAVVGPSPEAKSMYEQMGFILHHSIEQLYVIVF